MSPEFAKAVDPIFLRVLNLLGRIRRAEQLDREHERLKLWMAIDKAEATLGAGKEWELAKYAIVSWIDEVLIDAPWDDREWWGNNVLEFELFNSQDRHHQFFLNAKQASSLTSRDAMEVYYVCVILGFRGLYRDAATCAATAQSYELPTDLRKWVKQAQMFIRLGQGRPELSAPGRELRGARAVHSIVNVIWPWLATLMLMTVATLLYLNSR